MSGETVICDHAEECSQSSYCHHKTIHSKSASCEKDHCQGTVERPRCVSIYSIYSLKKVKKPEPELRLCKTPKGVLDLF